MQYTALGPFWITWLKLSIFTVRTLSKVTIQIDKTKSNVIIIISQILRVLNNTVRSGIRSPAEVEHVRIYRRRRYKASSSRPSSASRRSPPQFRLWSRSSTPPPELHSRPTPATTKETSVSQQTQGRNCTCIAGTQSANQKYIHWYPCPLADQLPPDCICLGVLASARIPECPFHFTSGT